MNDNGNEVEIKIEYFESFETDPLSQCEEIKQNDSCLINNRIVLDNQVSIKFDIQVCFKYLVPIRF